MTRCSMFRAVDRHFAGTIAVDDERSMRAHLPGCEPCRCYYRRHLVLEAVSPSALGAEDRLARGLGLAARRTRRWAPAAIVAAGALVAVLAVRSLTHEPAMTERGEPLAADAVIGFKIRGAEHAVLARVDSIGAADELSFAYRRTSDHPYLVVFALDERGRVYWYYPAWTDPERAPAAVPIPRTHEVVELPEAIHQDVAGDRLWVYSAFVDRPWTTTEIEALGPLVAPGGPILLERWVAPSHELAVRR